MSGVAKRAGALGAEAAVLAPAPARAHSGALARILTSASLRRVSGSPARPWTAAFLLVATQYIWHWPPCHELALLDDSVHYPMHVTMPAAASLFYSSVLAPGPRPSAPPTGLAGTRCCSR
jgi:cytochrome c oxidase assembly factor CtaG